LRSVERASRELDARVPSSVLKAGSRYVREGERDYNVRWTPDASLLRQVYDLAYLVTILQEICLLLAK